MERIEQATSQQPPVHQEVEKLAIQLERALSDPTASRETFFQDVDDFARALTLLHTDRTRRTQAFTA